MHREHQRRPDAAPQFAPSPRPPDNPPPNPKAPPQPSDQGVVPGGSGGAVRFPAKPNDPAEPVTPPTITHFEEAPFPPEAEREGIEGNVVLRLDIDQEGK